MFKADSVTWRSNWSAPILLFPLDAKSSSSWGWT